jgi:hypothetical protein
VKWSHPIRADRERPHKLSGFQARLAATRPVERPPLGPWVPQPAPSRLCRRDGPIMSWELTPSKEEALDQMVMLGERAWSYAIEQQLAHCHAERHHQGLAHQLSAPESDLGSHSGQVTPRHRLGGCCATIIAIRRDAALLFNQKPRAGYEIIKSIEEQLGGMYSPSPGVINLL